MGCCCQRINAMMIGKVETARADEKEEVAVCVTTTNERRDPQSVSITFQIKFMYDYYLNRHMR